eukprot:m.336824 g.336824  ORF g.336824 m.336824 type:complete len:356 (-) comp27788_c0_seq22:291-1358(-)
MSSLLDRVSDAVEFQALPPIVGWEGAPDVGLADALAGLGLQNAHLFIPTALDTAEDFIFDNPSIPITVDEAAAVNAYTHEHFVYRPLNDVLRERKREAVKPWFSFLKLLMLGLRALPTVPRAVTWRGVKKDLSKSLREGKKFFDWSVVSTSTNAATVQQFLGNDGPRTLIRVQGVTGIDIEKLSAFQESEIVFKPGTRFEVQTVIQTGTLTVVEIHELASDAAAPAAAPVPAPPPAAAALKSGVPLPPSPAQPPPATTTAFKSGAPPQPTALAATAQAAAAPHIAAIDASENVVEEGLTNDVCDRVASGEITTFLSTHRQSGIDVVHHRLVDALKAPSCRLVELEYVLRTALCPT